MTIAVEIPDDFMEAEDPARKVIEALAIAGRSGAFSTHLTRTLLRFATGFELGGFLKQHQITERSYGWTEYEEDLASIENLEARQLQKQ